MPRRPRSITAKLTGNRTDGPLMRVPALLVASLVLTTGCLGLGGDDAEDADVDAGDDAGANASDEDTSGEAGGGTSDHEHEAEPERHWDNKTGEVQGTNYLVGSEGDAAEETTEVPDAALEFSITLTVEEGEVDAEIYPPGCEESDEEPGEDCSTSLGTVDSDQEAMEPDGGNATWSTDDPDAGTWTIRLWKADAGTDPVPYTLEVWFLEEHLPGPGHHS